CRHRRTATICVYTLSPRRSSDLVGKVRNVTERTAEVVLITDSRSAVGGRVRDRGHLVLVEGTSDPTEERATVRLLDWEADLRVGDRKSTRLNSSHVKISYAVVCL